MTPFVRPLDLLLAFKAIALTPLLIDGEKRVACVLLDHYNRKTGQCDPSLGTIAKLLDVNRRTAIRAVTRLDQLGFILRKVHGGKFHRNSYMPVWEKFRQIEAHWKARRNQQQNNLARSNVSPWQRPDSHVESVDGVTQTYLNNSSQVISDVGSPSLRSPSANEWLDKKGLPNKLEYAQVGARPHVNVRRSIAARDSAERRWNVALAESFSPALYTTFVDAIDQRLMEAATDAELNTVGAGLALIMREFINRGLLPSNEGGGRG
jgi:hypothetical protein